MVLALSIAIFACFTANVAMGAFGGNAPLGDVGEMVVLLVASTVFVVAILQKEAERNNDKDG